MTKEEKLSIKEEQILFHTLGYDYQPRWNDTKGGYRNWFVTPENDNNCDYQTIKSLIAKGYMEKGGEQQWGGGCFFSVTDKGLVYVVDLWGKKKEQNKPSRSKRRYQAYSDWQECFSGSFKDFLDWLKITDDDRIFRPKEVECVEEFKKRWGI